MEVKAAIVLLLWLVVKRFLLCSGRAYLYIAAYNGLVYILKDNSAVYNCTGRCPVGLSFISVFNRVYFSVKKRKDTLTLFELNYIHQNHSRVGNLGNEQYLNNSNLKYKL
ncbi:hypothetical protein H5410_053687 [Solanum commersonii]|uniref:Uncharacterized protein n=1 Tax=Solanum commersonii TaxID=4109 RepID=A0A9J5X717_SOLCO|nr:hypothetical protein H5410_053687 [Solanum commersonii]